MWVFTFTQNVDDLTIYREKVTSIVFIFFFYEIARDKGILTMLENNNHSRS